MAALATAVIAVSHAGAASAQTESDFGTPPSGTVPILFDDRHVYAKPDEIRSGRLLAAFVRGRNVYLPLDAMFGRMGASVAYDPASLTATIRKGDTNVAVTVGKHVIVIDGVSRPLDVPPIVVDGVVLVPVRVLAEALGAYVAFDPAQHAVVVRYMPSAQGAAPAPPPPAVSIAPPPPRAVTTPPPHPPVPAGPPVPIGTPEPETFLVADVQVAPRVADAFVPNVAGATGQSYAARAAAEFTLVGLPIELGGELNHFAVGHATGPVTPLGGVGQTIVPAFIVHDTEIEARLGFQLSPAKYYLAAAYASFGNAYGYPRLGGIGVGLDKLPLLRRGLSYDGSLFYYPNLTGSCGDQCPAGSGSLAYSFLTYRAGLTESFGRAFLDAGFRGDHGRRKANAPSAVAHDGPYVGLGVRL